MKYFAVFCFSLFALAACEFEGAESGEVNLDRNESNVDVSETYHTSSNTRTYGNTQRFYFFKNDNAVLAIEFSTTDDDINFQEVSVNIFSEDESDSEIQKWIENQSQVSQTSAPSPSVYQITSSGHKINSSSVEESSVSGDCSDTYDKYKVAFYIDNSTQTNVYSLNSFTDTATVYLQTKAGDGGCS